MSMFWTKFPWSSHNVEIGHPACGRSGRKGMIQRKMRMNDTPSSKGKSSRMMSSQSNNSGKGRKTWFSLCLQSFPILLIGSIIAYTILLVYQFENFHSSKMSSAVVILKLPRSGSSWFVDLLNKIPEVYISKEIVQRHDLPKYSIEQRTHHIATALKRPTDKLTYKKHWFPSGRFVEDYLLHNTWKWMRSLMSVGVSVNPEYLKNFNWDVLRREKVRDPKFILYMRSNLVKQSISAITGKMLKENCDTSNLRDTTAATIKCVTFDPNKPFHLPIQRFAEELIFWSERQRFFLQYYEMQVKPQAQVDTHAWPVTIVYYEALQADVTDTLLKLATFIHPQHYLPYEQEQALKATFHQDTSSIWFKRTNDDLSLVLSNYEELRQFLELKIKHFADKKQAEAANLLDVSHISEKNNNRCLLVKEMLEEKSHRVFPVDMASLTAVYNCATYMLHETTPAISVKTFQARGREKEEEELEELEELDV